MADENAPPAVRLAAEKLLDRGYGKPTQAVDVAVENLYEDTPEDRAARDALYVKALENAAFDKARMLERVKSLNSAVPADIEAAHEQHSPQKSPAPRAAVRSFPFSR